MKFIESTPLTEIYGYVPILDSFGMEVEIRIKSNKKSLI